MKTKANATHDVTRESSRVNETPLILMKRRRKTPLISIRTHGQPMKDFSPTRCRSKSTELKNERDKHWNFIEPSQCDEAYQGNIVDQSRVSSLSPGDYPLPILFDRMPIHMRHRSESVYSSSIWHNRCDLKSEKYMEIGWIFNIQRAVCGRMHSMLPRCTVITQSYK